MLADSLVWSVEATTMLSKPWLEWSKRTPPSAHAALSRFLLFLASDEVMWHRRGVGDLVLVYKRVTALAGYTSRVAELLEAVDRLSAPDAAVYHEKVTTHTSAVTAASLPFISPPPVDRLAAVYHKKVPQTTSTVTTVSLPL